MLHDTLPPEQVGMIDDGFCPDCKHRGFVLGPRAGMINNNIECGNSNCRARFNITTELFSHHLLMAHRIAKESEGGGSWHRPVAERRTRV